MVTFKNVAIYLPLLLVIKFPVPLILAEYGYAVLVLTFALEFSDLLRLSQMASLYLMPGLKAHELSD